MTTKFDKYTHKGIDSLVANKAGTDDVATLRSCDFKKKLKLPLGKGYGHWILTIWSQGDATSFKINLKVTDYVIIIGSHTLRKNCPYSEFFSSVFSRIRTEYEEILGPEKLQIRTLFTQW